MLAQWAGSAPEPLILFLDEVQTLVPHVARPFFNAVQDAKSAVVPFLVLAAGTPEAPSQLREAGTHNERGFEQIPVGRLAPPATAQAFAEPARQSGRPLDDDALELLARESQDYPYFIQLLGRRAWDAAARSGAGVMDVAAVRSGLAATAPAIGRFYRQRFDEARTRGIHRTLPALAALFRDRDGTVSDGDLEPLLEALVAAETDGPSWVSLLGVLRDLGVLWETDDGVWELGIPSFGDYVLRRAGRNHPTDAGRSEVRRR